MTNGLSGYFRKVSHDSKGGDRNAVYTASEDILVKSVLDVLFSLSKRGLVRFPLLDLLPISNMFSPSKQLFLLLQTIYANFTCKEVRG